MNDSKIAWRVAAGVIGLALLLVTCHANQPDTVTCTTYGSSVTCDRS